MESFNITIVPEVGDLNLPVLVDYKTEDVINLKGKVEITPHKNNGDIKRSNVLHDGVDKGIKKDPKIINIIIFSV